MSASEKQSMLALQYETLMAAWSTYISFYTAFLAINLAALTFVFSQENDPSFLDGQLWQINNRSILCFTWGAFNLLAIVSSALMSFFTTKTNKLCASLAKDDPNFFPPPISKVGVFGGLANALALCIFLFFWIGLAMQ